MHLQSTERNIFSFDKDWPYAIIGYIFLSYK